MIDVERVGSVAVARIAHGKVNALDVELLDALRAQLDDLAQSPARAVVITGDGRAFSAGVDLFRLLDGGAAYAGELIGAMSAAFDTLFRHPLPVVAAVNGAAVAGGCILACACDRRIIADNARIGAAEMLVGVPFPAVALEILRHSCGIHTDGIVLTGRLFEASAASDVGLADEVVAADDLITRALEVAEALGGIPSETFRLTKAQLRRPTLDRIAIASAADGDVRRVWASIETAEIVRGYLERTLPRSGT